MRIVFMGTPEFAVPSLEALMESSHEVVAVVSAPDRPVGRGLKIRYSPIKQAALDFELPIIQTENLKSESFAEALVPFKADLFVVVGFRILPSRIFKIPLKGTINLHASLLPKYRGAAPINWAVMNGETESGVSVFFIEKKLDTGNIILQESVSIEPKDNAGHLYDNLMVIGAEILVEAVDMIADASFTPQPQDGEVTRAPKITKETCRIDWKKDVVTIHNQVRGLAPYPRAMTTLLGKQIKIMETRVIDAAATSAEPGTIVLLDRKKGQLHIATGKGVLAIKELQIAGKKNMVTAEFLKGYHLNSGDILS